MTSAGAYTFNEHFDPRNNLDDNRYAFYPNDVYDPYSLDQKRVIVDQRRQFIGNHQLFRPDMSRGGKMTMLARMHHDEQLLDR